MTKQERREYYRDVSISMDAQEREDRRRAAKRKWDATHYHTVSCRVPVETARRFRILCEKHGKTPYSALKSAIEAALRDDAARSAVR